MNRSSIVFIITLLAAGCAVAATKEPAPPLVLEILSGRNLNGTAGDFVAVEAQITNAGQEPVSGVTTYLSLADTVSNLPVDLEDWSAERGLYVGSIEPGQSLPLSWRIHFVKAGGYALLIVAIAAGSETPAVSAITHFHVLPKRSLDPGHILPVALGEPLVLVVILALVSYSRRAREAAPG
jgi:hypothetical protein